MTAMPNSPGRGLRAGLASRDGLVVTLGTAWLLLGLGAWIYARIKGIPGLAALPVAAAFLIEIPFYILPAFETPRAWLLNKGRTVSSLLLISTAIVPWLVYSL